jgi:hypothetical protein
MCNLGGSSTNTNQIIRGRDHNRTKLSMAQDFGDTALSGMGQSVKKPKTEPTSGITSSDNYQG